MDSAPRALIAGLGLIGGSIGIALRRSGWRVSYIDPAVRFEQAQASGAADEVEDRQSCLSGQAGLPGPHDVIILATPVDVALRLLGECGAGVITSVCSVMKPLRDEAGSRRFVAGHPLAGSAQRGLAAASGDLFRGKRWFVDADESIVDRVIADCGAVRERVDAALHDEAVALTSHLPQILSTALAAYLGRLGLAAEGGGPTDLVRFAGPGLATFLRLANSDASVWQPIIDANRGAIEPHVDELMRVVKAIIEGDSTAFEDAQRFVIMLDR